jgi:uncharacterized UBP type Zn finger protein
MTQLPDRRADGVTGSGPDIDAAAVAQLEAMGFPTVRCQKALLATGNSGADTAMTWLFEHMEDPGELRYSEGTEQPLTADRH